jgi:hypothetical protein
MDPVITTKNGDLVVSWENSNGAVDDVVDLTGFKFPKMVGFYKLSTMPSLESLRGSPEEVDGTIIIEHCPQLQTLVGAPKVCRGSAFVITECKQLLSLDGLTCSFSQYATSVDLSLNGLESLEGIDRRLFFVPPSTDPTGNMATKQYINWRLNHIRPQLDLGGNKVVSSILGLALIPSYVSIRYPVLQVDSAGMSHTIIAKIEQARRERRQHGTGDRATVLKLQRFLLDLGLDEYARP